MNIHAIEIGTNTCIETQPDSRMPASIADALDLVAACGDRQTGLLFINHENIPDAFYNLRTGLAGSVLLMFNMYRITAPAVVNPVLSKRGKFYDFALESNRHNAFRIFLSIEDALSWLIQL